MGRARSLGTLTAALAALALAACWAAGCGTPDERTRRDLEEVGRATFGAVAVAIDQGTVLVADPVASLVRFRANAPAVTVTLASGDTVARDVTVEVVNVAEDCVASTGSPSVIGHNTLSVALAVPPGGTTSVTLAPPAGTLPRRARFAWVGDVHARIASLARVLEAVDADASLEFVVFGGDVTDEGTSDELERFVLAADQLARPWYALIGNHDLKHDGGREFQRLIGRTNVVFDVGGTRLVLLDSASATIDGRVYDLLDEALRTAPPLAIVGMHVPPFDPDGWRNTGFASRLEGARLAARLADGGADLLICGHLHELARDSVAGVPVVVSGNGGMAADGLHYVAVTADAGAARVEAEPVWVP
ncbi:MAG: metallophosphoesterase [Deltaproteobacteria bacterium]|nr:metallophosphoesterase [Deltaproteobacteria bacterium]